MFRGLIDDAKIAAGDVAARFATRAAVAALFIVAVGFALAAITVQLVNHFGAITAYAMIAGVFAGLGLIGIVALNVREAKQDESDVKAEAADTADVASSAAAEAAVQLPIALLGSLLASPAGPASAMGLLRFIGRNFALIVLLGLLAIVLWPRKETRSDTGDAAGDAMPNPQAAE